MMEIIQSETFRTWVAGLRDQRVQAAIAARLLRLARGISGDTMPVWDGVSECEFTLEQDIGCTIFATVRASW